MSLVRPRPRPRTATGDVRAGARAMVPLLAAYAPLGLVVGAAVAHSADPFAAWVGTWLIYGGAAQLAVLDVLGHGSGWVTAGVVGLLVNLRLAAYATAMVHDWRGASLRRRFVAAAMLTDAPWALTRARTQPHTPKRQDFYLGASAALLLAWPAMVTAGVFLGDRVSGLGLTDLLMPLTLGAVLVPQVRDRVGIVAMATAAVCALLTLRLPAGPALAMIGLAGGFAAMVVDRARERVS